MANKIFYNLIPAGSMQRSDAKHDYDLMDLKDASSRENYDVEGETSIYRTVRSTFNNNGNPYIVELNNFNNGSNTIDEYGTNGQFKRNVFTIYNPDNILTHSDTTYYYTPDGATRSVAYYKGEPGYEQVRDGYNNGSILRPLEERHTTLWNRIFPIPYFNYTR